MLPRDASELARRLARHAEAVCRHYLSNGRRRGRYWTVGDVRNTPGRSLFVRLSGPESGPGAAGHWSDAASAEYGDLLDVIRESCGLADFRDVADEARRFLSLPLAEPGHSSRPVRTPVPAGSPKRRGGSSPCRSRSAGRSSRPTCAIAASGTCATRADCDFIRAATIDLRATARPRHGWRWSQPSPISKGGSPACIAPWLARGASGKAPVDTPRRAMGGLLGPAVRFWRCRRRPCGLGEGIETMLSLHCALPAMPMAAALSANHLAALGRLRGSP